MKRPDRQTVRRALAEAGRSPSRRHGQHFLFDRRILQQVAGAAGVEPGDVVLEVGPGAGTLTWELLERGADVVAVEVDPDMAGILRRVLGEPPGLTLLVRDILRGGTIDPEVAAALAERIGARGAPGFRLAANLPYQVASPFLVALWSGLPPLGGAVTVQREVAQRLVARPGERAYGPLTALLAPFARFEVVRRLEPGAFWPAPRVQSAVVRSTPRRLPEGFARIGWDRYRRTVHLLFQSRRKSLRAALKVLARRGRAEARFAARVLERRPALLTERVDRLGPDDFLEMASLWAEVEADET